MEAVAVSGDYLRALERLLDAETFMRETLHSGAGGLEGASYADGVVRSALSAAQTLRKASEAGALTGDAATPAPWLGILRALMDAESAHQEARNALTRRVLSVVYDAALAVREVACPR